MGSIRDCVSEYAGASDKVSCLEGGMSAVEDGWACAIAEAVTGTALEMIELVGWCELAGPCAAASVS